MDKNSVIDVEPISVPTQEEVAAIKDDGADIDDDDNIFGSLD
jgi:hypothetical protein